jgi:hypothetical protein
VAEVKDLILFLEPSLSAAEKRLSGILLKNCKVDIYVNMEKELVHSVKGIDHERFSLELQYTLEEIRERSEKEGFVLFMLTCGGKPTAFLYGYPNREKISSFFLDSVATLIEGKGIGSILVILALIYCYHARYKSVELYTEDTDFKGRDLVKFYEDLGFMVMRNDPDKGVIMNYDLEPLKIRCLYTKYIGI